MAVCKAKECVLQPKFPDDKPSESQFINKLNVNQVIFEPLYNCPDLEKLRNEGKLLTTIDFLNNN